MGTDRRYRDLLARLRGPDLDPVPTEATSGVLDRLGRRRPFLGRPLRPRWVSEPEKTWLDAIERECRFLLDLGYVPISVSLHFRGCSVVLDGPRGEVEFSTSDDFGAMGASVFLDGVRTWIDDLPGAEVPEPLAYDDGRSLPPDYVDRRVRAWGHVLRANEEMLRPLTPGPDV
jgi:hypothetical protein